MNNNYDMEALYLYQDGYGYRVGGIEKINEKSIRMGWNTKIPKDQFHKIHKLTKEEEALFKGELIKRMSLAYNKSVDMLGELAKLKSYLSHNEFIMINTEKLQSRIDDLVNIIDSCIPSNMHIGGKELKFYKYTHDRLEEAEK